MSKFLTEQIWVENSLFEVFIRYPDGKMVVDAYLIKYRDYRGVHHARRQKVTVPFLLVKLAAEVRLRDLRRTEFANELNRQARRRSDLIREGHRRAKERGTK